MRVAGRSRYPDVHFERQIDNSHIVREPDLANRRKGYRVLAVSVAVLAVFLGLALLHLDNVRYGYEIAQLKADRAALKDANQKLRLEQASLADPQRIDQLARQDLGLVPSEPQQVIPLGQGGEAGGSPVMARNFGVLTPASRGIAREP